mmetsp:Transcript_110149/g.212092  ORF Transcript_110149/g.212092 Transcript_110149/m.212092 type:complete len:96 (+) Transcript_110149:2656-2943(+)
MTWNQSVVVSPAAAVRPPASMLVLLADGKLAAAMPPVGRQAIMAVQVNYHHSPDQWARSCLRAIAQIHDLLAQAGPRRGAAQRHSAPLTCTTSSL